MPSISRNNSETSSVEYASLDTVKNSIDKTVEYLTFAPSMTKMKLLQLYKLSELSSHLDVKLYLNKTFIPKAAHILKIKSLQYVKDKLLEIIASMCHVNEVIDRIGRDRELIKFIFCSFGNCTKNFRLQKTLCKLLSLITREIEIDATSKWMCHLTRSCYMLGPNILRLLTQTLPEDADDLFMEIIVLIYSLSELTLPDETNVLERLFNTRDLISALLCWFVKVFVRNVNRIFHSSIFKNYFWIIIDLWQKIIHTVTKFESFRCNLCDYDNDIDRIFILQTLTFIQHSFRVLLLYGNKYFQSFENIIPLSVVALSQNIKLFSDLFSDYKITLRNMKLASSILSQIEFYNNFDAVLEDDQGTKVYRILQVMDDLDQYCERSMNKYEWSCKDIMEGLLVWKYYCFVSLSGDPFTDRFLHILVTYNTSQNVEYKILDLITSNTCYYLNARIM